MYLAKERGKPPTLLVMEALARRMKLDNAGERYLRQLASGDSGELGLDGKTCTLGDRVIGFHDLLLQPKSAGAFQWDTILLCGRVFALYEVKNASGEFQYGSELFVSRNGFKMKNPMIQMTENKNSFILLLEELGYAKHFDVEAYSVMINPSFTLFGEPDTPSLLQLSQLDRHFAQLERGAPPLTALHRDVMNALLSSQGVPKVFWEFVPHYTYEDLRKGVCCERCGKFELLYEREQYRCLQCQNRSKIRSLIEFQIHDYQRLFPNEQVTSLKIRDFCNHAFLLRRIKRVMNQMGFGE